MNKTPAEMVALYCSGKTVKQISEVSGASVGKVFYTLKAAGCTLRKPGHKPGWKPSSKHLEKIAKAHKGKTVSAETRKRISEARKSTFNGMNGFGHTKAQSRGYVLAYAPLHPRAHTDGYVMLHTILMEQSIGRYLNDDEVVHHKNHIRNDNRIDNLVLMNKTAHCSMHMNERNAERMISY